MNHFSPQLIGIIAGIFTAISLLPQLVKTIREHKTDNISALIFILLLCGNGLWVYYGALREDWPIIITNAFSCCVDAAMLVLKLRYSGK